MYLPTFWKLCQENRIHAMRHVTPWAVPTVIFCVWISYYSLYNWIYTSVIPPEKGVKRRILGTKL